MKSTEAGDLNFDCPTVIHNGWKPFEMYAVDPFCLQFDQCAMNGFPPLFDVSLYFIQIAILIRNGERFFIKGLWYLCVSSDVTPTGLFSDFFCWVAGYHGRCRVIIKALECTVRDRDITKWGFHPDACSFQGYVVFIMDHFFTMGELPFYISRRIRSITEKSVVKYGRRTNSFASMQIFLTTSREGIFRISYPGLTLSLTWISTIRASKYKI